jgi:hypothetical protein
MIDLLETIVVMFLLFTLAVGVPALLLSIALMLFGVL